jgi:hypothetical protein
LGEFSTFWGYFFPRLRLCIDFDKLCLGGLYSGRFFSQTPLVTLLKTGKNLHIKKINAAFTMQEQFIIRAHAAKIRNFLNHLDEVLLGLGEPGVEGLLLGDRRHRQALVVVRRIQAKVVTLKSIL